jgi:hypothetical protein
MVYTNYIACLEDSARSRHRRSPWSLKEITFPSRLVDASLQLQLVVVSSSIVVPGEEGGPTSINLVHQSTCSPAIFSSSSVSLSTTILVVQDYLRCPILSFILSLPRNAGKSVH